jgi:hypothetical protein
MSKSFKIIWAIKKLTAPWYIFSSPQSSRMLFIKKLPTALRLFKGFEVQGTKTYAKENKTLFVKAYVPRFHKDFRKICGFGQITPIKKNNQVVSFFTIFSPLAHLF